MKKLISAVAVISLLLTSLFCLTGCPAAEDVLPVSVSFILSIRDKFPGLSSNMQALYDSALTACRSYGEISYALVEGTPGQTDTFRIKRSGENLDKNKEAQIAEANARQIVLGFTSLKAKTPESDTLSAITLGANALNASSSPVRRMTVFDNGIVTAGLLNQLNYDVLSTDPDIVIDKLKELHALPDLKGVEVTWVGLGCVSGDQQQVPPSYFYKLKTLWTAVIEAAGGTVYFDPTPVTGEEAEGLPYVSSVEFPEDSLGLTGGVIRLPEDTVKFNADSAEFADEATAWDALKPFAAALAADPAQTVLVAGTTARIGGDGVSLSYDRCEAVKRILVANGVSASQIQCLGLGSSDNCLRAEDHNADGSLNEEMAAKNRAIYIMPSNCDTAKRLRGEAI